MEFLQGMFALDLPAHGMVLVVVTGQSDGTRHVQVFENGSELTVPPDTMTYIEERLREAITL